MRALIVATALLATVAEAQIRVYNSGVDAGTVIGLNFSSGLSLSRNGTVGVVTSSGTYSYAFGGFVPANYGLDTDFVEFVPVSAQSTVTIFFTVTSSGSGETGVLALWDGSVAVCELEVTCGSAAGVTFATECVGAIGSSRAYSLRWLSQEHGAPECNAYPAGNGIVSIREG